MFTYKTKYIEKPVETAFQKLGRCIGKYPWLFFILPLLISGVLGGGFYFLQQREVGLHDQEIKNTSRNSLAKEDKAFVKQHFPHREEFSRLRLYNEGVYASLTIAVKSNILTVKAFQEIIKLDERVKSLKTSKNYTYANLCAKEKSKCASNEVLDIVNYDASKIENLTLNYPSHERLYLGGVIDGVKYKPGTKEIETANATRLFYFLQENIKNKTDAWLTLFNDTLSSETNATLVSSPSSFVQFVSK